ncbi:MAG: esterase [Proteobacteria bacterium]|nr:esterase [Pseudomonadota bacterium]
MTDRCVVVARPERPTELVLLFHGVGASAQNLVPLAQFIADAFPDAMVVSVDAPHPSGLGAGREWFSVLGVTEADRPARVAQAMPMFLDAVARWQHEAGLAADRTTLVGFSQGAIMSLESTQVDAGSPAARVVSLAGRLAAAARRAPAATRFHFIHGSQDGVIPLALGAQAARSLEQLGAHVTLDTVAGLGHQIDGQAARLVVQRLREPS